METRQNRRRLEEHEASEISVLTDWINNVHDLLTTYYQKQEIALNLIGDLEGVIYGYVELDTLQDQAPDELLDDLQDQQEKVHELLTGERAINTIRPLTTWVEKVYAAMKTYVPAEVVKNFLGELEGVTHPYLQLDEIRGEAPEQVHEQLEQQEQASADMIINLFQQSSRPQSV